MFGSSVLNEIWILNLSSALVGVLFFGTKLIETDSGVRLLLELQCGKVNKHVAFFTICAKLLVTMTFSFTFLDVIVVSDLKKNSGGSTDLAKKGTDRRICIY